VTPQPSEITALLYAWANGDPSALDRLTPQVYAELRRMARRYMRSQPEGQTLQTTALVHELFLRLFGAKDVGLRNRAHFFAVSGAAMRQILVDAARARRAGKRGGLWQGASSPPIDFDQIPDVDPRRSAELIALDDALQSLAVLDGRKARVIELRFFGGLSVEETAALLQVSPQTVLRDWKLAKAWLLRELRRQPAAPAKN
jgi:RNA polymerase sigma factor (TIGR02999 family)